MTPLITNNIQLSRELKLLMNYFQTFFFIKKNNSFQVVRRVRSGCRQSWPWSDCVWGRTVLWAREGGSGCCSSRVPESQLCSWCLALVPTPRHSQRTVRHEDSSPCASSSKVKTVSGSGSQLGKYLSPSPVLRSQYTVLKLELNSSPQHGSLIFIEEFWIGLSFVYQILLVKLI